MYKITLHIPVSKLRNDQEAESMAESMLEHLAETFNDDNSLKLKHAQYNIQKGIIMKNLCAKTRTKDAPYETWVSYDGQWTWKILKKWQIDDYKPFARWFCFVTSPFCPDGEYGDVYVKDILIQAQKVNL